MMLMEAPAVQLLTEEELVWSEDRNAEGEKKEPTNLSIQDQSH